MTADEIIDALNLAPHPEGGWYRETWRADAPDGSRPAGTAIYFLLRRGERSHWHRVDAAETWHHYAGAPLHLCISADEHGPASTVVLGPDLIVRQVPQATVPATCWQSAESTGAWTLVGCTVSPGFQFSGFELAEPGFDIPKLV